MTKCQCAIWFPIVCVHLPARQANTICYILISKVPQQDRQLVPERTVVAPIGSFICIVLSALDDPGSGYYCLPGTHCPFSYLQMNIVEVKRNATAK